MKDRGKITTAEDVSNYYGHVMVRDLGGTYSMGIEDYSGMEWVEISKKLYDAFVEEFG